MRGTFANIRLRNALAGGREGPYTVHLPDGDAAFDLRRGDALPGGRDAAPRHRRPRVRIGVVARLGGQGSDAPRRAGRPGRELRADPPLQPRRDGRPAAPVRAGRERRLARAHGRESYTIHGLADDPAARARHGRRPDATTATRATVRGDRPARRRHRRRTTSATAGSCRRSCGGSPPTEPSLAPPETAAGASGVATPEAGDRPIGDRGSPVPWERSMPGSPRPIAAPPCQPGRTVRRARRRRGRLCGRVGHALAGRARDRERAGGRQPAPAASPSPQAASASPAGSPSAAAASPSASSGPGRYGGDYIDGLAQPDRETQPEAHSEAHAPADPEADAQSRPRSS